jgi:hypothetical protein
MICNDLQGPMCTSMEVPLQLHIQMLTTIHIVHNGHIVQRKLICKLRAKACNNVLNDQIILYQSLVQHVHL